MGINGFQTTKEVKCIMKHLIKVSLTGVYSDSLVQLSSLAPGINRSGELWGMPRGMDSATNTDGLAWLRATQPLVGPHVPHSLGTESKAASRTGSTGDAVTPS